MSMIAYCGLDCERCDAYLATGRDDDALREKTAELWTELNGVPITKDMIHCLGCCGDGVKTPFCDSLCAIRQCALQKALPSCGICCIDGSDMESKVGGFLRILYESDAKSVGGKLPDSGFYYERP